MPNSFSTAPTVDVNVPRFSQAVVASVLAAGFLLQRPIAVVAVALVLVASAINPRWALLSRLYTGVIRPYRRSARIEFEDARPPRFAQQLGAGATLVATFAFATGIPLVGWSLALLVATLAFLAATSRICLGCIIYERWLA